MIPVGTLCYIVGRNALIDEKFQIAPLPSRICTVTSIGGSNCGWDGCNHVCVITFQDGMEACVNRWAALRPITPPGIATTRDEPIAEMA